VERYGREGASQWIKIAPKEDCTGMPHLEKVFQDIVDQGGEGIILRDPKAVYTPGRTRTYLKHKVFSLSIHFSSNPNNIYLEVQGYRSKNCQQNRNPPMGMWTVRVNPIPPPSS